MRTSEFIEKNALSMHSPGIERLIAPVTGVRSTDSGTIILGVRGVGGSGALKSIG